METMTFRLDRSCLSKSEASSTALYMVGTKKVWLILYFSTSARKPSGENRACKTVLAPTLTEPSSISQVALVKSGVIINMVEASVTRNSTAPARPNKVRA